MHSFKKLALKHHPLKNAAHMQIHLEKFHEICEAYEVLSNRKLHIFSIQNLQLNGKPFMTSMALRLLDKASRAQMVFSIVDMFTNKIVTQFSTTTF